MRLISIAPIWVFRNFIAASVKREFQAKYRNTLLGALWVLINPLAMIAVYTIIFSHLMQTKLPGVQGQFSYSVFLCSGILIWGLFSEIIGRSQSLFLENANLLKKINFPRICLPIILWINALINFSVIFSLFIFFLIFTNQFPGWVLISLIPITFLVSVMALGIGLMVGVLNVFFRDVGQFFNLFMQFWFWFTPIVYPINVLPEGLLKLMPLNPMMPLVSAFQNVVLLGKWPSWHDLLYPLLLSTCIAVFALKIFRSGLRDMIDEL
jgi:lipopolysaccharide transport system permease protein